MRVIWLGSLLLISAVGATWVQAAGAEEPQQSDALDVQQIYDRIGSMMLRTPAYHAVMVTQEIDARGAAHKYRDEVWGWALAHLLVKRHELDAKGEELGSSITLVSDGQRFLRRHDHAPSAAELSQLREDYGSSNPLPRETREKLLAHILASKSKTDYQRSDLNDLARRVYNMNSYGFLELHGYFGEPFGLVDKKRMQKQGETPETWVIEGPVAFSQTPSTATLTLDRASGFVKEIVIKRSDNTQYKAIEVLSLEVLPPGRVREAMFSTETPPGANVTDVTEGMAERERTSAEPTPPEIRIPPPPPALPPTDAAARAEMEALQKLAQPVQAYHTVREELYPAPGRGQPGRGMAYTTVTSQLWVRLPGHYKETHFIPFSDKMGSTITLASDGTKAFTLREMSTGEPMFGGAAIIPILVQRFEAVARPFGMCNTERMRLVGQDAERSIFEAPMPDRDSGMVVHLEISRRTGLLLQSSQRMGSRESRSVSRVVQVEVLAPAKLPDDFFVLKAPPNAQVMDYSTTQSRERSLQILREKARRR